MTQRSLFWIEAIEKEDRKRLEWFAKNRKTLEENNQKESRAKVDEALWDEIKKRRAETMQSTTRHSLPHPTTPLPPRDYTVMMEPMRPVPPEVHDLIYQGISHEDEGRRRYLKERYKDYPEDKFYLTDCTSWVYGWNIKDVELHKLYRVPRLQIIKSSFYRRGGVERDPDHYRDAVNVEAPMFFPQL